MTNPLCITTYRLFNICHSCYFCLFAFVNFLTQSYLQFLSILLKMAADEVLLEFLHFELVNYVSQIEQKDSKSNMSTLEYFGFNTGYRIIEKLTKDWPRFKDELDTVKFICTDFWASIYKKPIDNLRTNHQGVYVLQDNNFRFMAKISSGKQYLDLAPMYIAFTSGLLRGALGNLGIDCIVTAEVQVMPTCKFHIKVQRT